MATLACSSNRWNEFLLSRVHEIGLAPSSIHTLRIELRAWQRWLDERETRWTDVTPADVALWLGQIENCAFPTFVKKRWAIKSLYAWAAREGIIEQSPWISVAAACRRKAPRVPRYVPSVGAIETLLARPDSHTMVGIRDRAILELLYAAGLRAAELVDLTCEQVSTGTRYRAIRLMGKGRRERLVIYGERAAVWLRFYANIARRPLLTRTPPTNQYFVSSTKSGRFDYTTLHRLVRRYASDAGLPRLTPHSLRHAFATHLYENGAKLPTIQMLLGHADVATTALYVAPSAEHLQLLVERHHPRGSMYRPLQRRARNGDTLAVQTAPGGNAPSSPEGNQPRPLFGTDGPEPLFG